MWDVIVAGAGPAGSVAATILARAGARVLLLDRARFPRDKLCGDSLNPGMLERLRRLHPTRWAALGGLPIDGMLVSGPGGVSVAARYPRSLHGRTILRRDLDGWLLGEAIRAGVQFEEGVVVRRAIADARGRGRDAASVTGVSVQSRDGRDVPLPARLTIAADGRRSAVASSVGLTAPAPRPRRWAVGAYFDGVHGVSTLGEMHIRRGWYLGVAPLPGGATNACLVAPRAALARASTPERALREAIESDEGLRERFAAARIASRPAVLGPLGVDASAAGLPGLLLAGDAAGFIDPMTGDGLRFAVEGAEIAAAVALDALACGRPDVSRELGRRRAAAFAGKWRFNRALRSLVERPGAVTAAARGAALVPALVRSLVAIAGDCGKAALDSKEPL